MLFKCSFTMVFTCPLVSWYKIVRLSRESNNIVVFPFPFQIFLSLANQWFTRFQGQFLVLKTRSYLEFYPLIRPPRILLALSRGRILGFIRSLLCLPSTILPILSHKRQFPFTANEIRRHFSRLSGTFREQNLILDTSYFKRYHFIFYQFSIYIYLYFLTLCVFSS